MLTYGFYNSKDHDRVYDAIQLSSIFDGIIRDGIFMSIGDHLQVTPRNGMTILVGSGRAWFNHSWTLNDSPFPLIVPPSDIIMKRIDVVVLEVGTTSRVNNIKIVKGTPSNNPVRPTLINNIDIHQYPLAYINIGENANEIRQADITNMVGTSQSPFVTGILETISIDSLIAQWGAQWNDWSSNITKEYIEWAKELHDILDEPVAGNLALRILELEKKEAEQNRQISELQNGKDSIHDELTKIKVEDIRQNGIIENHANDLKNQSTRIENVEKSIKDLDKTFVKSATVRSIVFVGELPSDAASHSDILYLIPEN